MYISATLFCMRPSAGNGRYPQTAKCSRSVPEKIVSRCAAVLLSLRKPACGYRNRILSELQIRVGDLDVSIVLPREAALKTTLARILIALVLSPYIFRKFVLFGLSQDFQISSDTLFSSLRLRKLNRVTSMN